MNFDAGKKIEWEGHFEQNGAKTPVNFDNMRLKTDGSIIGGGSDSVGEFQIQGKLSGKELEFTKQYVGAHAVVYKGKLRRGTIKGNWEIPGNCDGKFEITMKSNVWSGFYKGNDQDKTDFEVDINLEDNSVFGLGDDEHGAYTFQGGVDPDTSTIVMTKSYFGGHAVHYAGIVVSKGGVPTNIQGSWHIPEKSRGNFRLNKAHA